MKPASRNSLNGFSLIEVVIALGIVSFAVVILLALLPVGLSSSREGSSEEAATELLAAVSADIRNAPPEGTETPLFHLGLNPHTATTEFFGANGAKTSNASEARFQLTISERPNANPGLQILHLAVAWPAEANPPTGSAETLVMRANPLRP